MTGNHAPETSSENRTHSRRIRILEAVVRDYVATHEPVGSRSLVERYNLGVSPATVRNDLAALEDRGYLAQPHTSAGRIPTDAGYRSFVDSIDEIKPLSAPERRAIERFLDGAVDLDDAVIRAVRLLAKITNQVALVQYPSLNRVCLRHIELIKTGDRHIMLVFITDAGRVEQRYLAFSEPFTEEKLAQLTQTLNVRCSGLLLGDVAGVLENICASSPDEF
ncbi:MAG: heat-inducible transcription repressor HrcA, partial [Actinomycetaceae bacterium]|nr:heat-inducible transcription repressor HrcA [Actinomycetaceae bacterium]